MYGYFSDGNENIADEINLGKCKEFEQLKSLYPEHEIYLFLGTNVDMALFCAPGVLAMLVETRAPPGKIF